MTLSENSVLNKQVFWPWSSFKMSACTVPRTFCSTQARMSAASASVGSRPLSARNFSRFWSMAVFMNMANMDGAGPLMVMDTLVAGEHKSKPSYKTFMSSSVAMLTPELPTLP